LRKIRFKRSRVERPVPCLGESVGSGARLSIPALHDDATREDAYGPAKGLPATKVGTCT
jgi:hypothetical protein